MKKINKVTGYQYLQMKYDNELVDTLFSVMELDQERAMPIAAKRGSGCTTMLVCEMVLTKLHTGKLPTISVGYLANRTKPDYELPTSTKQGTLKHIQDMVRNTLVEMATREVYYIGDKGKLDIIDVAKRRNHVAIDYGKITVEYFIHEVTIEGKSYSVTANVPEDLEPMRALVVAYLNKKVK